MKIIKAIFGTTLSFCVGYSLLQTLLVMNELATMIVKVMTEWNLTHDTYVIVAVQMITILLIILILLTWTLGFWIKKTIKWFREKKK